MKAGRYWPYSQCTAIARQTPSSTQNEMVWTAENGFQAKAYSRLDDRSIPFPQYIQASKLVESKIKHLHGEPLAMAFAKHHENVSLLAALPGANWQAVLEYDMQQRESWSASHGKHDFTTLDWVLWNRICSMAEFQRPAPPAAPPAAKRPAPVQYDTAVQAKRPRPATTRPASSSSHCFRCGRAGHLPQACQASTTLAGRAVAAFSTTARSRNALAGPDGRSSVCFNFASTSSCSHGASCISYHGCTICGATDHGAGSCTHVA